MPDPLPRLLSALRTAVPELDGTALAEALWLAAHRAAGPDGAAPRPVRDAAGPAHDGPERTAPEPPAPSSRDDRPAAPAAPQPPPAADATTATRPLHERLPGSATPVPGRAVAAPHTGGLPRALELTRALRPWKRRWPEGRGRTLDIDATVDGYARSGELLPVLKAAPERWFDLVLVVDRSPGMRVWAETVTEFTTVLDRLGAFRTLQVTDLTFDAAGEPRAPGPLRAADGRRLVVVISDCMAGAWRRPEVWHLLRQWAGAQPTALLNPLPTKLWRHGGLNLPTTRFTPAAPGTHRSRVPVEPPLLAPGSETAGADGDWLPVPVLSLTPHSLGRWSDTLMRGDPAGCTAVLVPPTGRTAPGPARPTAAPLPPAELTRRFLRTASPRAARLTVLCAPFDRLSLRLLHLVRARFVPDATVADVAEAVTSGVFAVTEERGGTVELALPPEAREVLREHLPAHEVWALHQALDDHIASRGTGRTRLPSVAYDGRGPQALAAEKEAFARASRRTLELLGLAEPEAEPADGADAAGAGVAGADAAGAGVADLPPAPEPYVGHGDLLESVAQAIAEDRRRLVRITVEQTIAGAGRTAFALTLAHRVRAQFPDGVFFVPFRASGRRPVPWGTALLGLLADLGGDPDTVTRDDPPECLAAVAAALRGRRVLLVLDQAENEEYVGMLAARLPEGCAVFVTARGRPTVDLPDQLVVELPPLEGEDASRLLRAAGARTGEPVRRGLWWPLSLRILGSAMGSPDLDVAAEAVLFIAHQTVSAERPGHPAGVRRPQADPAAAVRRWLESFDGGRALTLFRLAEVTEGEFTFEEARAVLPGDASVTSQELEALVRQGLLEHARRGRYVLPSVVYDEVVRLAAYDERRKIARARIGAFHRQAAAALYRERHPDSALPDILGVEPVPAADPDAWVANALEHPALDADTLLLLRDLGASLLHRNRFAGAAIRLARVGGARLTGTAARALLALVHARQLAGEPEGAWRLLHQVSADVLEADERIHGLAALLHAQLALAVRPDMAREAVDWAKDAVERFDGTASAEYREALQCLEQALAATGAHRERLEVQRKLLLALPEQCTVDAARLHLRTADAMLRLGRPEDARTSIDRALTLLDTTDDPATREAARELLSSLRAPRDRIVIAVRAATPVALLAPAVAALIADLDYVGSAGFESHAFGDELVLLVDGSVPIARLVQALAERLPLRLERAAVRLAVHRGPVVAEAAGDVGVEYTRMMLRSAEFDKVRANYPDDVVLCVSPEAFAGLSDEAYGGELAESYLPREVHSASGEVVCVILTPLVDLSAYDADILGLARVFNNLDPGGGTLSGILRDALDTVLDPRATGRFDPAELDDRERARVVGEIEQALEASVFPFRSRPTDGPTGGPTGGLIWERPQGAVPFTVSVSLEGRRRPTAAARPDGTMSLFLHAEDARARWSAWLVRGRNEAGAPGAVAWLHRDAPFPENVLLTLTAWTREAVLSQPDDVGRVAELFRRVRFRTVPGTALRPLIHDRRRRHQVLDPVVRLAGAALREDGVLLLAGNARGRAMAETLRLPVPDAGSYVSAALTRRRSEHGARPSVVVDGAAWVVARAEDATTPLPPGFPGLRMR
ncbi:NaeI family type II restriction endonuclease [Streptomyces sp. NPDC127092]|uniref:NaeI family type II restriction endonuclease n=1 Tax=Streptomyces sp. NPDC127092 TaxID=3347135 RepID=UPI00365E4D6F